MRTLAILAVSGFVAITSLLVQSQSATLRGSRRVVLSGAGHLMYLEKPEEFTRVVVGFIESN